MINIKTSVEIKFVYICRDNNNIFMYYILVLNGD